MINTLQKKLILYTFVILSLIVISTVLGMNIGSSLSSPQIESLIIEDPLLSNSHPIGTPLSEAGFTGFEAGGITGKVITSGSLTEIISNQTSQKIFFSSNGRESVIEYLGPGKFFIIERNKKLAVGDRISIKIENGAPQGILRITLP